MALSGRLHLPTEIVGTDRLRHDGYYFHEQEAYGGNGTTLQTVVFWADGTTAWFGGVGKIIGGELSRDGPYFGTPEQAHEAVRAKLSAVTGAKDESVYVMWGTYRVDGSTITRRSVTEAGFPNPVKYKVFESSGTVRDDTSLILLYDREFRFRRFDGVPSSWNWTMRWRR